MHDVVRDRHRYRRRHRRGEDGIARIACGQVVGAGRKFAGDKDDVAALGTLTPPIAVAPLKKVMVPVATCNGTPEPTVAVRVTGCPPYEFATLLLSDT